MSPTPLKVLLVEDHPDTNGAIVRMLRRAGFEVASALDADTALQLSKTQKFDLVVSDIGLPETNGWELLKRIKSEQPGVRAIALTGFGYPNDMKRSREMGFDMHITKPAPWPEIRAAIVSLFPQVAEGNDSFPATP